MSYLECANGCTIRDQHLDACDGFKRVNGEYVTCTGCVPRGADVGCLCLKCWRGLEIAWSEWAILEPYLVRYARLSPRNSDGRRGVPGPSVPLPQTYLAVDEVRSWLRGEPQDARAWVSTVEGARDAVGFTRAVQAAARAHQIQEQSRKLRRFRCTCGSLVIWLPPARQYEPVSVQCDNCGRVVTESDQWAAYRKTADGWEMFTEPALDVITRIEETKGKTA